MSIDITNSILYNLQRQAVYKFTQKHFSSFLFISLRWNFIVLTTDSFNKHESPEAKGFQPKAGFCLLRVPFHRRGKTCASKVDDRKLVLILLLIGQIEANPGPNHHDCREKTCAGSK